MNDLTSKEVCLCNRCHNIKAVKATYAVDKPAWRIQGFCDRCGKGALNLWPMTRKLLLERLAEV
jgi:hypothetical protein